MNDIEFFEFTLDDEEVTEINNNLVDYKKQINKLISQAQKFSKQQKCIYCGKNTSSFCNSHSIPAFCLKNIAMDGKVFHTNELVHFPLLDFEKGIKNSGTFRILCRECDSRIFQQYENPDNYESEITPQMVAQIAMKNYLKSISKRTIEYAMSDILKEHIPYTKDIVTNTHFIQNLDLEQYRHGYEKAKRLSEKNINGEYYVFYYEKLDYVVPIAFQGNIALALDLNGQVINDILR